ncbi:MAG: SPOR domain-containing protein [Rubrivivax sp.]|nr:MAG: SPOR domain-containing protein [Rubrivivax sp.]
MPLPSFLQRLRQRSTVSGADAALPLSSADIEVARVRARRRLVGMVVLVGVGVVGLPWLFETQPRPLSPDVQVVSAVAPHGGGPTASSSSKPSIAAVTVPVNPAPEAEEEVLEEPAKPASKPVAARASAPATSSATPKPMPAPVRSPASQAGANNKPVAREAVSKPPAPAETAASRDAARARALLDGKPPTAVKPAAATAQDKAKPASEAANTRYVVQIGAFSDAPAAREVRLKAERAGVKTYTQEVTVNGGKKIRVRVGPYANKAEADKAVDTLRKAGMSSALLTL